MSGRTVTIKTTDTSLHTTSAVTFTVTSTRDDTGNTNDNGYSFAIILNNPCKSATLLSPTVSNMSVDDGSTATATFTDVGDTHGEDYGALTKCGTRTFSIEDSSGNAVSWASVALTSGTTYTITLSPTSSNTELQTSHSLRVKVVSDSYSSDMSAITVSFTATVNTPACNCNLQTWDAGTGITSNAPVGSTTTVTLPTASVAADAYTSSPAMRACSANACSTGGSITSVVMSDDSAIDGSWMATANSNA